MRNPPTVAPVKSDAPRRPASSWMPERRRVSEENWFKTPWAARRPDGPAANRSNASLVEPLNFRPRKVRRQNGAIVLPSARAADRSPLAHPHRMSGACPGGDDACDLAVGLRHSELKRGAREQAIRFRAQHRADANASSTAAVLNPQAEWKYASITPPSYVST